MLISPFIHSSFLLKKKKRQKQNKTLYFLHLSPAGSRDVLIHFRASLFLFCLSDVQHFPGGSDGKESSWNSGDSGSIPGLGRSPGEGNSYSLQYSCLEDPLNRGAWRATVVLGVAKVRHNWVTEHTTHARTHTQYMHSSSCLQAKGLGIGRTLESSGGLWEQTLKQPALDRIDGLWECLRTVPVCCSFPRRERNICYFSIWQGREWHIRWKKANTHLNVCEEKT